MKKLLLLAPILALLVFIMPADEAHAERLLLSGNGELEKRFTTNDASFEVVFDAQNVGKNSFLMMESGSITIQGEEHFMHPTSVIRDMADGKIIRVAGVLDDGNAFHIYGVRDGTDYEMFGKLKTAENVFPIQFAGSLQSLELPPPEVTSQEAQFKEDVPVLDFAYFVEDPVFIQEEITVRVRAHDSSKSPGGLTNNIHNLEGVKFKIDLEQNETTVVQTNERTVHTEILEDQWKHMATIEGQTNRLGEWTGAKLLASGVYEPKQFMRVTITATWEDQTVTEQFRVWVTEVGSK